MNREVWTGHDPDGEQGSEGRRQYGHAVLAKKINEEEDFPLSAADYVEQYGDHPIRSTTRRSSRRGDLRGVEKEEFGDFVEFHQELGRAMRENGYWFYEGAEQFVDGSA